MSACYGKAMKVDPPKFLPFHEGRPAEPLVTLTNRSRNKGGWITAVTRIFDPSVGYCGRCPVEQCHVIEGVCLVVVKELISIENAPNLSMHGRTFVDPLAPTGVFPGDGL